MPNWLRIVPDMDMILISEIFVKAKKGSGPKARPLFNSLNSRRILRPCGRYFYSITFHHLSLRRLFTTRRMITRAASARIPT